MSPSRCLRCSQWRQQRRPERWWHQGRSAVRNHSHSTVNIHALYVHSHQSTVSSHSHSIPIAHDLGHLHSHLASPGMAYSWVGHRTRGKTRSGSMRFLGCLSRRLLVTSLSKFGQVALLSDFREREKCERVVTTLKAESVHSGLAANPGSRSLGVCSVCVFVFEDVEHQPIHDRRTSRTPRRKPRSTPRLRP